MDFLTLRKRLFRFGLVGYLLLGQSAMAQSSIWVVANYPEQELKLSPSSIRNLFMGSPLDLGLQPVNLPPGNMNRIQFNTKVIGLTESRIQSYWAQMRFSGRKEAPIELSDEEKVIEYVLANKGAIAYLPAQTKLPDHLQVVLEIK